MGAFILLRFSTGPAERKEELAILTKGQHRMEEVLKKRKRKKEHGRKNKIKKVSYLQVVKTVRRHYLRWENAAADKSLVAINVGSQVSFSDRWMANGEYSI